MEGLDEYPLFHEKTCKECNFVHSEEIHCPSCGVPPCDLSANAEDTANPDANSQDLTGLRCLTLELEDLPVPSIYWHKLRQHELWNEIDPQCAKELLLQSVPGTTIIHRALVSGYAVLSAATTDCQVVQEQIDVQEDGLVLVQWEGKPIFRELTDLLAAVRLTPAFMRPEYWDIPDTKAAWPGLDSLDTDAELNSTSEVDVRSLPRGIDPKGPWDSSSSATQQSCCAFLAKRQA
jgi:hypothetical protein